MRELLGGESDGDDGSGVPIVTAGAAAEPAAGAAGEAADGASRERRSAKDSKERRRDKCGFPSCQWLTV